MAAITTAAAGNWSATGTWTGGVIPGNGDTVTLNHAVTCDDNRTVGVSPVAGAATAAIAANAGLTIATGARLTMRGDLTLNNVPVTLNAGATYRFDASQAGTPSTARYVIKPTANNQNLARFVTLGTAGSRCTVDSDNTNGGANGRITDNGLLRGGLMDCTYTDFLRIGDASNRATEPFWNNNADTFSLVQCIFDACGTIGSGEDMGAGFTCRIDHVTMKNTVAADGVQLFSVSARSGGLRALTDCVFDANMNINIHDITTTGTLIQGGFTGGSAADAQFWSGNLVYMTAAGSQTIYDGILNDYWIGVGALVNKHFTDINSTSVMPNPVIDGVIFELSGSTDIDGDCVLLPAPSSAKTYNAIRCIVLPNDNGGQSGTMITALGSANVSFSTNHCTICATNPGSTTGVDVGETYNAHTGMCLSLKDNIVWSATAGGGYKIQNINGSPNNDVVTAANADYNAGWNLSAGSKGKGYNTPMTGTPGAHDVDGDPRFLDSTRNIKRWDISLGGPGTAAHALAELSKRNDASGYNSNYTIAALWAYVREGFRPRSEALRSAASDKTDIGAVPMAALSAPGLPWAQTNYAQE